MWKNMKAVIVILVFSIALNTAFGTIWAVRRLPAHLGCIERKGDSNAKSCVSCPLHRQLGTSEKQWQEIEPRLMEFKSSAQDVCQKTNQLRKELIDLVAAPQTDLVVIRAKQDEILTSQRRMQELVISHLLAEKELLTPQQQKTLFDIIRKQSDCAGRLSMLSIMSVGADDIPQTDLNPASNGKLDERR